MKDSNLYAWEMDHSKLPQDGQRMISYLENKTKNEIDNTINYTVESWINKSNMKEILRDTVRFHMEKTGKLPIYYTAKFLVTHNKRAHQFNHDVFTNVDGALDQIRKAIISYNNDGHTDDPNTTDGSI
jgi:hypothetical protein